VKNACAPTAHGTVLKRQEPSAVSSVGGWLCAAQRDVSKIVQQTRTQITTNCGMLGLTGGSLGAGSLRKCFAVEELHVSFVIDTCFTKSVILAAA